MADTLDLITLSEGHVAIHLPDTDTSQDTALAMIITAVSRRLDELCGAVVLRDITDEVHDGGRYHVILDRPPTGSRTTATTVTAVKEYDAAGVLTTLTAETVSSKPAEAFAYEPQTNTLYRRRAGYDYCFRSGRRSVLVSYTAGRYATTATVDKHFKAAAQLCVAHLWGSEVFADYAAGAVPAWSVPRAVLELLGDELAAPGIA